MHSCPIGLKIDQPKSSKHHTRKIGTHGEQLVKDYLEEKGYRILSSQWHCRSGEVDLIASQREWLVFVEVKTRSAGSWDEAGLLAISFAKQKRLIKCALCYLELHPDRQEDTLRFDVALVQRQGKTFSISTYLEGVINA